MRISAAILPVLVSTAVLLSCGQRQPSTEVDPTLGRSCFEAHQDALPPGSQYEGIAEASENRITIRAMTGIKVEQFNCSLASDGTVRALED
jgi:hypothetical protein